MIKDIIAEHGIECELQEQSAYIYTERDDYVENIEKEAKSAKDLGIKASVLDKTPLPFNVKAAVRFEGQAQFHPRKYLLALAKLIPGNGSHIFEQSRVVDIDDGYILKTVNEKRIKTEKLIIASHYPIYNKAGLYTARIFPMPAILRKILLICMWQQVTENGA